MTSQNNFINCNESGMLVTQEINLLNSSLTEGTRQFNLKKPIFLNKKSGAAILGL